MIPWYRQNCEDVEQESKVERDKEAEINSQNDGSNEVWDFCFISNFRIFSF